MNHFLDPEFRDLLKQLRDDLPQVAKGLGLSRTRELKSWKNVVNSKLLPRLSPDFPLTAAICGGGSSGKSTLFNTISKEKLSLSGGRAGINRRILISAPSELFRKKDFLSTLFEPFGSSSKPLENREDLTVPGCPLYVMTPGAPRNMVLMDTPDFDTGANHEYANREIVSQALEASDILVYIFTNSNYNNRDNTSFISDMLTGIGMRKCFLVYRVYPGFTDEEVTDHAMTVAKNLYGARATECILGIYRADEDNAVAAGEQFMELAPARDSDPPFFTALKSLDPRKLRPQLLKTILEDTIKQAENIMDDADKSLSSLNNYLDILQKIQNQCVQATLRHFPMDMLLKRFVEIWMETDPGYIRAMRKTGNVVGMPFKFVSSTVRWMGRTFSGTPPGTDSVRDFQNKVATDMLNAADTLRHEAVSPHISVKDGIEKKSEPAPPILKKSMKALADKNWEQTSAVILDSRDKVVSLTADMEEGLSNLVDELRKNIGLAGRIKQTFSAMLNVIPATVAITYVLSTGDPVGGAGLKVKLTGLFGLQDLYALVAIPATTGLSKKDRDQVNTLIEPIASDWLNKKLVTIEEIFEKQVTGDIIETAEEAIGESERLIPEIRHTIEKLRKASEKI
ncbi:hypothetical protein QUF76_06725 [Desulfobacterales bacterium HSG16]|nr:hypothetical protein [Desulfobacterales bacterium HSG16]